MRRERSLVDKPGRPDRTTRVRLLRAAIRRGRLTQTLPLPFALLVATPSNFSDSLLLAEPGRSDEHIRSPIWKSRELSRRAGIDLLPTLVFTWQKAWLGR